MGASQLTRLQALTSACADSALSSKAPEPSPASIFYAS